MRTQRSPERNFDGMRNFLSREGVLQKKLDFNALFAEE